MRSRIAKLVLAVLAGLLVSIGVAWEASAQRLTHPPRLGPPASAHGKYVPSAVYQGVATELVYIDWYGLAPGVDGSGEPARANWYPERSASHSEYTCVIAQASGWPMFCLWREHQKVYDAGAGQTQFHWVHHGSVPLEGQLILPQPNGTLALGAQPSAALPLLPLWEGLIVDSVCYALAIAAVFYFSNGSATCWESPLPGRTSRGPRISAGIAGPRSGPQSFFSPQSQPSRFHSF